MAGRKYSGRRFSITRWAYSGRVLTYQKRMAAPAMLETMPSQARRRTMSRLKAGSWIEPATIPPTTAVMVNMKAVRIASCAKVLAP